MKHISKFFMPMFFFMTAIACRNVLADIPVIDPWLNAISTVQDTIKFSPLTTGTKKQICPENQYLYSCSGYRLGVNWLKSVTLLDPNDTNNPVTTHDYYINGNVSELLNQMRNFFHGGPVKYKNGSNWVYATSAQCQQDRETILNSLCNQFLNTTQPTCRACPNNAKVKPSTVEIDEINGGVVSGSWYVYTLADCYMNEFTDSTGTFIYVNDITDTASHDCYYSGNISGVATNIVYGDEIDNFTLGSTNSSYYYYAIPAENVKIDISGW